MKVKELIEKLQEFDSELDVYLEEENWYEIKEVKYCENKVHETWTQKSICIN